MKPHQQARFYQARKATARDAVQSSRQGAVCQAEERSLSFERYVRRLGQGRAAALFFEQALRQWVQQVSPSRKDDSPAYSQFLKSVEMVCNECPPKSKNRHISRPDSSKHFTPEHGQILLQVITRRNRLLIRLHLQNFRLWQPMAIYFPPAVRGNSLTHRISEGTIYSGKRSLRKSCNVRWSGTDSSPTSA